MKRSSQCPDCLAPVREGAVALISHRVSDCRSRDRGPVKVSTFGLSDEARIRKTKTAQSTEAQRAAHNAYVKEWRAGRRRERVYSDSPQAVYMRAYRARLKEQAS